jgi:hypothetical protein
MVAGGLLAAIRARVAARGMTFTELARASGVQPGNLRRMLTSTTASPRLGSVMRLLPPLHARIAPAAARTAAELAAFLEDQRRRSALPWDQLLSPTGPHDDKIAARLAADPEQMSLDVVMHLAEALHVELALIDDDEAPTRGAGEHPTKQGPRPARRGPVPRRQRERPAPLTSPLPSASSSSSASPSEPAAPPPSAPPANTFGLAPLRPPRLGRYRDASPAPTPTRPSTTWTPPQKSHALEEEVVARLASLSSENWSEGFAGAWSMLVTGAELPVRFIEGLGAWTASAFQRFHPPPPAQPPPPEPPDGCFDALDPSPLVRNWLEARQGDGNDPTKTRLVYDNLGVKAFHAALDGETVAAVRLGAKGSPHRLVHLVHVPRNGDSKAWLQTEVRLAIKIGGELHDFVHVHAGPVFGEIIIRERAYLLAAISSLLAIVEVRTDDAHVVWGGRPARLSEIDLEMPPQIVHQPGTTIEPAASTKDVEGLAARLEAETRSRVEAEAALASRDDDRRALQTTTKKLAATTSALEAAEQALNAVQSELKLHSQASTNAQQQVQMVRAAANQLMEALLSRNKAHDQAIEQREAAEARATEAEQARDALNAELTDLRRQLHDQVNTSAEALAQARSQLEAERQRRSNAESLAAARGQKIEAQKTELANLRQIATQLEAPRAEPAESDRLAEVQKELDDLRQAQAADAAHIRELIEADRFPEVLSFFVTRILGVPVKDGDHALALLEEKHPLASALPAVTVAERPLPPEPLLPTANAPVTNPSRAKVGRNEPCPCGSGKKYKRCCWLSSS